jgi:hypothetical protein
LHSAYFIAFSFGFRRTVVLKVFFLGLMMMVNLKVHCIACSLGMSRVVGLD